MTPTQRRNLRKLAKYLLLPASKRRARFSMERYSESCHIEEARELDCGSVGCAIGQGPDAGIAKRVDERWCDYAYRVFGYVGFPGDEWHWCFSQNWAKIDNTARGAAKRILWLLEHDLPDDWHKQMFGEAPLCYRKMKV